MKGHNAKRPAISQSFKFMVLSIIQIHQAKQVK